MKRAEGTRLTLYRVRRRRRQPLDCGGKRVISLASLMVGSHQGTGQRVHEACWGHPVTPTFSVRIRQKQRTIPTKADEAGAWRVWSRLPPHISETRRKLPVGVVLILKLHPSQPSLCDTVVPDCCDIDYRGVTRTCAGRDTHVAPL